VAVVLDGGQGLLHGVQARDLGLELVVGEGQFVAGALEAVDALPQTRHLLL
jgi:hypothetical protein